MAPGERHHRANQSASGAELRLRNLMPETVLLPLPDARRRIMLPGMTVTVPAATAHEFTFNLLRKHGAIVEVGGDAGRPSDLGQAA